MSRGKIFGILFVFFITMLLFIVGISLSKKNNQKNNQNSIKPPESSEHFEDQIPDPDPDQDIESTYKLIGSYMDFIIESKKKVLIISCYGYGNMGDNMYAEVFTKYLHDCETIKLSDHSMFVDSRKNFIRTPPIDNYLFDYLIIGGGGLITADKLIKSLNLPYYINDAQKRNKPLFIISCGVQGTITNFKEDFAVWKNAMSYAKLITVRTKKDKELLSDLTDSTKIHYFRDLGYVFPHIIIKPSKTIDKTTTLIIAGPVDDHNEIIKQYIKTHKTNVIIANMGSLKDDNNNKRMLKMNFPDRNIFKYYGAGRAPEFTKHDSFMANQNEMEYILKTNPDINGINPGDLSLSKIINIIYNSDIVFTGRYHGMIFARSMGIKYETLGMGTNKILWEESETNINEMVLNSYNHIKLLRKHMGLRDTSVIDITKLETSIKLLNS